MLTPRQRLAATHVVTSQAQGGQERPVLERGICSIKAPACSAAAEQQLSVGRMVGYTAVGQAMPDGCKA